MNGYSRGQGGRSYHKGVAAGFEYDDSSGDEFMFGDGDDDDKQTKGPRQGVFNIRPENNTVKPKYHTSAPWLQNGNESYKQPEEDIKPNIKSKKMENAILEDMSIQGEDIRQAIAKGDTKLIKKALDSGFAVDTKLRSEWTGLMYAANNGKPEVLKLFLAAGADPNFQKDMFTPLMALCSSASKNENDLIECAKHLLAAKARINTHDRHLMTPLMYAAQNGRPDLVKLLIESKADMNTQETRGWSALAFAASSGHTHVAKVLLNSHANINLCAYDGQSPSDLAYANGYTTLADMLENPSTRMNNSTDLRQHAYRSDEQESGYVTYGDLELFLFGLELGHLVKVFQEHQLTFQDFLKITDKELNEIGITELGVKKKILEAIRGVHVNEWDLSGLSVDKKSKINTLEAAAIMANVTKHLTCIQSSVLYLQNYINENQEHISKDDPSLQKILVQQTKEGLSVANRLHSDIHVLQSFACLKFPRAEERPCDLIDESSISKKRSGRKRVLRILGGLTVLGIVTGLSYKLLHVYPPRWPSLALQLF